LSSCYTCMPGMYQGDAGNTSCTNCPTGKFETEWGAMDCTACPLGRIGVDSGSDSRKVCRRCPANYFARQTGRI
jgi:hypothetical protein